MRISAIELPKYLGSLQHNSYNKNKAISNKDFYNEFNLSNYNLVSTVIPLSISFKGQEEKTAIERAIFESNEQYQKEIEAAEKELEILLQPGNRDAYNKAKREIDFCEDFDKNRDKYYTEATNEARKAVEKWTKNHNWLYRIFNSSEFDGLWASKMEPFEDRRNRYWEYDDRRETNINIISATTLADEQKNKRIAELKKIIQQTKLLIDYGSLQEKVNDMLSGKSGLNNRIAGYKSVKTEIEKFIKSLENSMINRQENVPACVLLYGATGTGKTTFLHSIEDMAKKTGAVEIIRFDDNNAIPFIERFRKAKDKAIERYNEEGKRTVLLMDDAEKYFCMRPDEARAIMETTAELTQADYDRILELSNSGETANVADFKYILDNLSKIPLPNQNDKMRAAMSIFITTNHPNLISRELLHRPEKMNIYHVGPAEGIDLNEVVKFYVKDKAEIINSILLFKDREDRDRAINGLSGLSNEAKNNIKKLFREGRIEELKIDPDQIDYNAFTEDFQPNRDEGAYSNVMIKQISLRAFENYLKNPQDSFQVHFYEEFEQTNRDIEPRRYVEYENIAEHIGLFKSRKDISLDDLGEFIKLLNKYNKNLIKEEDKKKVNSYILDCKKELSTLKEKQAQEIITEDGIERLNILTELLSYVDSPERVKEYLCKNR